MRERTAIDFKRELIQIDESLFELKLGSINPQITPYLKSKLEVSLNARRDYIVKMLETTEGVYYEKHAE